MKQNIFSNERNSQVEITTLLFSLQMTTHMNISNILPLENTLHDVKTYFDGNELNVIESLHPVFFSIFVYILYSTII